MEAEKIIIESEELTVKSYYIVGDRPVKVLVDDESYKTTALALNWKTCEFEPDIMYLSEISKPGRECEIEKVSREEFAKTVKGIKARKKLNKLSKPRGFSM